MRTCLALALVVALAGCSNASDSFQPEGKALGRIDTAQQAAQAAAALTNLPQPVDVLDVVSGRARDIYTGVYPSWTAGMERAHEQFMAKLERPAWRVHLATAVRPPGGSDCVWEELVIDHETGSVLLSVCANGIPEDHVDDVPA